MIKSEAEIRRKNTIKELKKEKVDVIKDLPLLSDVENVHIKSFEEICKRALACAISASLSSELDENPDPELAIKIHQIYLQKYSVESSLLSKEKLLFTNNYSNNDLIDVSWNFETLWVILWSLGLVPDLGKPFATCDSYKALFIVKEKQDYEDFKACCHPRSVSEILDAADLYLNYYETLKEKQNNKNKKTGKLVYDVVLERKRAFMWLLSEEKDYYNFD